MPPATFTAAPPPSTPASTTSPTGELPSHGRRFLLPQPRRIRSSERRRPPSPPSTATAPLRCPIFFSRDTSAALFVFSGKHPLSATGPPCSAPSPFQRHRPTAPPSSSAAPTIATAAEDHTRPPSSSPRFFHPKPPISSSSSSPFFSGPHQFLQAPQSSISSASKLPVPPLSKQPLLHTISSSPTAGHLHSKSTNHCFVHLHWRHHSLLSLRPQQSSPSTDQDRLPCSLLHHHLHQQHLRCPFRRRYHVPPFAIHKPAGHQSSNLQHCYFFWCNLADF